MCHHNLARCCSPRLRGSLGGRCCLGRTLLALIERSVVGVMSICWLCVLLFRLVWCCLSCFWVHDLGSAWAQSNYWAIFTFTAGCFRINLNSAVALPPWIETTGHFPSRKAHSPRPGLFASNRSSSCLAHGNLGTGTACWHHRTCSILPHHLQSDRSKEQHISIF
jgi:hypothetical protein